MSHEEASPPLRPERVSPDALSCFDPSDIELLFRQDAAGAVPRVPVAKIHASEIDFREDGSFFLVATPTFSHVRDAELVALLADTQNASKLPLRDSFVDWLLWMAEAITTERDKRLRLRRITTERGSKFPAWQTVDLISLVESRCGPGRKLGREYWFHCPFGHEDRHPSLEVNAEKRVWHCWSCGQAGGVREWNLAQK